MFVPANRRDLGTKLRFFEIPVDRRSPLGNPFKMKRDTPQERERAIREYRRWLWGEMQKPRSAVLRELHQILGISRKCGKVKLVCWCAPKPCHAQIIANALNWLRGWERG